MSGSCACTPQPSQHGRLLGNDAVVHAVDVLVARGGGLVRHRVPGPVAGLEVSHRGLHVGPHRDPAVRRGPVGSHELRELCARRCGSESTGGK